MRFLWTLIAVLLLEAALCRACAAELTLRVKKSGEGLLLNAAHSGSSIEVPVKRATAASLMAIRFSIECEALGYEACYEEKRGLLEGDRQIFENEELLQVMRKVGQKIFGPLTPMIKEADLIKIVLPIELLRIPMDAVYLNGNPLFLQKPIVYALDKYAEDSRFPVSSATPAILISDPTADPGKAVPELLDLFPTAKLLSAKDLEPLRLQSHEPVTLAVISAHGRVGRESDDIIQITEGPIISPELIVALQPKLVYLDSCNLAGSARYLKALRAGGVKYLLAPIVSNEAGNSSTQTIQNFFRHLTAMGDAVSALHATRKDLYAAYGNDALRVRLWRAFAFRIYALN